METEISNMLLGVIRGMLDLTGHKWIGILLEHT